jgi:hypothetical protein
MMAISYIVILYHTDRNYTKIQDDRVKTTFIINNLKSYYKSIIHFILSNFRQIKKIWILKKRRLFAIIKAYSNCLYCICLITCTL